MIEENSVAKSPLGKHSKYVSVYSPGLLAPIPRAEARGSLGINTQSPPFTGMDLWNAYEISWLDDRGKPHVAMGRFAFPADSRSLVESKSLKLYLNSFNQTRFSGREEVATTMAADLSVAAGAEVIVDLLSLDDAAGAGLGSIGGENIDGLDVEITEYELKPGLLRAEGPVVDEILCSDLLRSNCPVTGQPDWGSVLVKYRGAAIDREALLKYVVSFREHGDFHESCVERIFVDILEHCAPERLTVSARYTRRGGLDINPFRTNCGDEPVNVRLARQ